ncbi:MAG: hypothetical protein PF542_02775 [Nanoarchaeota archaeon]|jgi:hypothetical protein|nr:hypothetical protein [Nanoarchaeota archaeon]
MEDVKKFVMKKLFFSKILDVDSPGIIYNKVNSKYSNFKTSKKRIVFYFEDLFSGLQDSTIEKLGYEKSHDLWYKIGKDLGLSYVSFPPIKEITKKKIPEVIDYFFQFFVGGGCTAAASVEHLEFGGVRLIGKDNVICRRNGFSSFIAGVCAGILTFMHKKNFDSDVYCKNCPYGCNIVCLPNDSREYVDVVMDIQAFPLRKLSSSPFFKKSFNLKDFLSFNKLKISFTGKWEFYERVIIPSPHYILDLVYKNYALFSAVDVFKESLVLNSENFFKNFISDIKNVNLSFISNIFSSLGWGMLEAKKVEGKVAFDIINPATNEDGFYYLIYVLNGFLNSFYGKKYFLEKKFLRRDISRLFVSFTEEGSILV